MKPRDCQVEKTFHFLEKCLECFTTKIHTFGKEKLGTSFNVAIYKAGATRKARANLHLLDER